MICSLVLDMTPLKELTGWYKRMLHGQVYVSQGKRVVELEGRRRMGYGGVLMITGPKSSYLISSRLFRSLLARS